MTWDCFGACYNDDLDYFYTCYINFECLFNYALIEITVAIWSFKINY